MSFAKKIMTILLILVILINFIRVKVSANENNNIEINKNFIVNFTVENKAIDLSNLKINMYISTPIYDNDEIINFNNTFYKSYYVEENSIIFERPTDYFLLELDLETLPDNFGSNTTSIFVDSNKTNVTFNIFEVYDIETQYLDGEVDVKFYNSNNEIIYVSYSSELIELTGLNSYQLKIKYGNKQFQQIINVNPILNMSENELLTDISLADNNLQNIINSNSNNAVTTLNIMAYQKENSRFIIYYDANTMDINLAVNVANEVELIEQFYFNLGFDIPVSNNNNEYQIWLKHDDEISAAGVTNYDEINVDGLSSSLLISYIELNYELVAKLSPFSTASNRGFVCALAHEFFHAIQWEMLGLFSDSNDAALEWMTESFATMFGFCYLNSLGIEDQYFKGLFSDYFHYFIRKTISVDSLDDLDEYHSFLFPVFIVKKFGYQPIKEIILSYDEYEDTFETIDSVLNEYGYSFSELFLEFSIGNLNPLNTYQNYNEWYISQFRTETHINKYSQTILSNNNGMYSLELPYASNKYFYLLSEKCEEYDAYVTISFDNKENLNITSLRVSDDNGQYYRTYELEGNSITIPQYNFGFHTCDKLFFVITNSNYNSDPINITYSINIEHHKTELLLGQETFIEEHLHSPLYEYVLEFVPQSTGLYKFDLLATTSYGDSYCSEDLQILDSSYNVIKKFNIDDGDNFAINVDENNSIICKLLGNETYYIKASYSQSFITVSVLANKISDENCIQSIELNSNDEYISESTPMNIGDNLIQFFAPRLGYYNISFEFEGNNDEEMAFGIFKVNNNEIVDVASQIIYNNNQGFSEIILFEEGCTYYIGYFGSLGEGTFNLNISRYIEHTVLVGTDPNPNVTVGSEVLLNNGEYGGTSILQGLNRCIYINSSYPSKSRLSYNWYSLDESKAFVSKYGTVTAIETQEESTVKILAVYKNNPLYVAVIEFTVKPDKSNIIRNVTLTTDKREGDIQTGTEVSENNGAIGGTLMHVGYTRLITLGNNSPSSLVQDFIWESDNASIVSVSSFGTLIAHSKGSATITGIYKFNSNFVCSINIDVE